MRTSPITTRQSALKQVQNSALAGNLQGRLVSNVTSGDEKTAPYVSQDRICGCLIFTTLGTLLATPLIAYGVAIFIQGITDNNNDLISRGTNIVLCSTGTAMLISAVSVAPYFFFERNI